MNKLVQRLLIFFVGLPLIILLVYFLPHKNQLALNIAVIVFSALGAFEFASLLKEKNLFIHPVEAMILGAIMPAVSAAIVSFGLDERFASGCFIAALVWILLSRIFSSWQALDGFINRFAASLAVLVYPGMLMEWIIYMGRFENANIIILVFLLIVIANDSAAWAFGMLFGNNNRNIIPVSPNKSIAGFAGGTATAILVGAGAAVLLPGVFVINSVSFLNNLPPVYSGILLGLLCGITGSLGDLAESALKRSSGLKDSGNLMPGRGGILDSIDSIALAAPVFYLLFSLLFVQS
ncbi:MAG: phosphatidate cytidylyltransferase [Treponema sp.]|jgi:phosphatidate cytidylyltransferase|nr:phosphatidate cytidylyltransferase [Treponema sp.]